MCSSSAIGQFDSINRDSYAVVTVNAAKSYGRHKVFQGVNMNVKLGIIYALLGPSGCGKTSLLRCLLAQLKLDEGIVLVFGKCPGASGCGIPGPNVGYMSQQTSIHHTLTIFEYWMFYGRLFGLTKEEVVETSCFFVTMLRLPSVDTLNGNLSSGQLRRVAFATALIHRPKLLILDEPTVGTDPIIRHQMWQYLQHVTVEYGTTIILTTHYIEEARTAHCVGLMHNHTLAVEGKTSDLIKQFNSTSLEDVFLKVCEQNTDIEVPSENAIVQHSCSDQVAAMSFRWTNEFLVRWHVIQALVIKNFIHIIRFKGVIFFLCMLPSIQFISTVISHRNSFHNIPIMVINEDLGPFGDQYLTFLNQDFFHMNFANSSADLYFEKGVVNAILIIPKNFTEAMKQRVSNFPLTDEKTVLSSTINITLDQIDVQISQSATFFFLDAFFRFQSYIHNSSDVKTAYLEPVLSMDAEVRERLLPASSLSIIITVMTMAAYYSVAAFTALSLFFERHEGHLECSQVAGVSSTEVILGLTIVLLAISLVQMLLLNLLASFLISVNVNNQNWPLIFILLCCHGMAGMSFGFILTGLFDDIFLLAVLAGSAMLITSAISGYFWPIQAAPYFFQTIIRIFPHYYISDAIATLLYWEKKDHSGAVARAIFFDLMWFLIFQVATVVILIKRK